VGKLAASELENPSWRKVNQNIWWHWCRCVAIAWQVELPTNPHPKKAAYPRRQSYSGEEKPWWRTNLAVAWAKSGSKVVLVDADLQSPSLHKWFKARRGRA